MSVLDVRPFKAPNNKVVQAVKVTEDNLEHVARWCGGTYVKDRYYEVYRRVLPHAVYLPSKYGFQDVALPGTVIAKDDHGFAAYSLSTFSYMFRPHL